MATSDVDAVRTDGAPPPVSRREPVYLDHNATTPVDPCVVAAMLPFLHRHFGNPSSGHFYGNAPRAALDLARARIRALIGAPAEGRIVFTGSGSEADALAIAGAVGAARGRGVRSPHVVTQVTEHPAVLAAAERARREGARVSLLPVDGDGRVRPDDLRAVLSPDTVLVSVMHANNETGVVQPIAELASIARAGGALFHTDAAQSVGKIHVDVQELGVDLLTLVGHKMYAPKGVAALYVRDGVPLEPLVGGGGQELGLRAGTENVPYAVGLGVAADLASSDLSTGAAARLADLRDQLEARLLITLPGRVEVNGDTQHRLPHVLNVSIAGTRSDRLLAACPEIAASAGSACHTGSPEPSPVLTAMGVRTDRALSAVRLSLGRWTTPADVERAAAVLAAAAQRS